MIFRKSVSKFRNIYFQLIPHVLILDFLRLLLNPVTLATKTMVEGIVLEGKTRATGNQGLVSILTGIINAYISRLTGRSL